MLNHQRRLTVQTLKVLLDVLEGLGVLLLDVLDLVLILVDLAQGLQLRLPTDQLRILAHTRKSRRNFLQLVVGVLVDAVEIAENEIGLLGGDLLDVLELVVLPLGVLSIIRALNNDVGGNAQGKEVINRGTHRDNLLRLHRVGVFTPGVLNRDFFGIRRILRTLGRALAG